jgi:hypothetical protein
VEFFAWVHDNHRESVLWNFSHGSTVTIGSREYFWIGFRRGKHIEACLYSIIMN